MRYVFILLSPFRVKFAEKIIDTIISAYPCNFLLKKTNAFKVTKINIFKCFPYNTDADNNVLAFESLKNSIISIYETLYSWSRSEHKISKLAFKQENRFMLLEEKATLFYSLHNRSIDLLLGLILLNNSVTTLYKTIKYKKLDAYVKRQRSKNHSAVATASIGGVKAVIKALKSGTDVCFASDQVPADGFGVESFFFEAACYSSNLVESLSAREDISTCLVYLTKNEFGYIVSYDHLSSAEISTDKMNRIYQKIILKNPKEYSWEYKKFRKIKENKSLYSF